METDPPQSTGVVVTPPSSEPEAMETTTIPQATNEPVNEAISEQAVQTNEPTTTTTTTTTTVPTTTIAATTTTTAAATTTTADVASSSAATVSTTTAPSAATTASTVTPSATPAPTNSAASVAATPPQPSGRITPEMLFINLQWQQAKDKEREFMRTDRGVTDGMLDDEVDLMEEFMPYDRPDRHPAFHPRMGRFMPQNRDIEHASVRLFFSVVVHPSFHLTKDDVVVLVTDRAEIQLKPDVEGAPLDRARVFTGFLNMPVQEYNNNSTILYRYGVRRAPSAVRLLETITSRGPVFEALSAPDDRRVLQPIKRFADMRTVTPEPSRNRNDRIERGERGSERHERHHIDRERNRDEGRILANWRYDGIMFPDFRANSINAETEGLVFTAHILSVLSTMAANPRTVSMHAFRHFISKILQDFCHPRHFLKSPEEFSPQDRIYLQLLNVVRFISKNSATPSTVRILLLTEVARFVIDFFQREGRERSAPLVLELCKAAREIALEKDVRATWETPAFTYVRFIETSEGQIKDVNPDNDAESDMANIMDIAMSTIWNLAVVLANHGMLYYLFFAPLLHRLAAESRDTVFYSEFRKQLREHRPEPNAWAQFVTLCVEHDSLLALIVRSLSLQELLELQRSRPSLVLETPLADVLDTFAVHLNELQESLRPIMAMLEKIVLHRRNRPVVFTGDEVYALQRMLKAFVQREEMKSLNPNLDPIKLVMHLVKTNEPVGRDAKKDMFAVRLCMEVLQDWLLRDIILIVPPESIQDLDTMRAVLKLADNLANIYPNPNLYEEYPTWPSSFRDAVDYIVREVRDAEILETWVPQLFDDNLSWAVASLLIERGIVAHQRQHDAQAMESHLDRFMQLARGAENNPERRQQLCRRKRVLAHWFTTYVERSLKDDFENSVVQWPLWQRFLTIFGKNFLGNSAVAKIVLERAQDYVIRANNHLNVLAKRLKSGEISRHELAHLQRFRDNSITLLERGGLVPNGLLDTRFLAVRVVETHTSLLRWLMQILVNIDASTETRLMVNNGKRLKDVLRETENMMLPLKGLVDINTNDGVQSTRPTMPLISDALLRTLPRFRRAYDSPLFHKVAWQKIVQHQFAQIAADRTAPIPLDAIQVHLLESSLALWQTLFSRFSLDPKDNPNGLRLFEVAEIFGEDRQDNGQQLQVDLEILYETALPTGKGPSSESWVTLRRKAIRLYQHIGRIAAAAKETLAAAVALKIKLTPKDVVKYLSDLQNYQNPAFTNRFFADWFAEAIDKKAAELLQALTREHRFCLDAIPELSKFITWLKQTNFVDDGKFRETYSILSQTVEGAIDLDRVDAFRVARDQVARLVSLTSPTTVVDLLKACLSTRATLTKDKLVSMNDEVEWLQGLKERVESSEEENSFTQISKLMTRYVLDVGVSSAFSNTTTSAHHVETAAELGELYGIVRMHCKPEFVGTNQAENVREIDKLHDLRSRLMLVMGDSTDGDVDESRAVLLQSAHLFTKLLDAAITLGKEAVSLQAAGWHGADIEITSYNCDLDGLDHITTKTRELEERHKRWLMDVRSYRQKFHVLNFFTLRQLTTIYQLLIEIKNGRSSVPTLVRLASLLYVISPRMSQAITPFDNQPTSMKPQYIQILGSVERRVTPNSPYLEFVGYYLDEIVNSFGPTTVPMSLEATTVLDQLSALRMSSKSNYTVIVNRSWLAHLVAHARANAVKLPWDSSRILLCTPETRAEELELFIIRMFQTHPMDLASNATYCICVPAKTHLNRRLQEKALRMLLSNTNESITNTKPRLLVLCGESIDLAEVLLSSGAVSPLTQIPEETALQTFVELALQQLPVTDLPGVLVVTSNKAGMGKSRMIENLVAHRGASKVVLSLFESSTVDEFVKLLREQVPYVLTPGKQTLPYLHLAVNPTAPTALLEYLLFQLLVVGTVVDSEGNLWNRSGAVSGILVEMPTLDLFSPFVRSVVTLMPTTVCPSPSELIAGTQLRRSVPFDFLQVADSEPFQRIAFFLRNQPTGQQTDVPAFDFERDRVKPVEALRTLVNLGFPAVTGAVDFTVPDPPFRLVAYLVTFLESQFKNFVNSPFILISIAEKWPGFIQFVYNSMLETSRDLVSPSLSLFSQNTSNSNDMDIDQPERRHNDLLAGMQFRRLWLTSNHHFVLCKPDASLVFFGFNITRMGITKDRDRRRVMDSALYDVLTKQQMQLTRRGIELEHQRRSYYLETLGYVCRPGEPPYDPDDTYVLTEDNVQKLLAIHFRFASAIPVVIIGETGCGKTRLVTFLAGLMAGVKIHGTQSNNLELLKVHGGTTLQDIRDAVQRAEEKTKITKRPVILFLDECNTSEHMAFMKELVCDRWLDGRPLNNSLLHIIAVCNPYRKHSDAIIKKLSDAGLGYRASDNSTQLFGGIPLRHLVYRVQPLPDAMAEVAWDFGSLDEDSERQYIANLVERKLREIAEVAVLGDLRRVGVLISTLLEQAQKFMREQPDECSFVSLRDIERALELFQFFYHNRFLFDRADAGKLLENVDGYTLVKDGNDKAKVNARHLARSLILMLAVCYHNKLSDDATRVKFRKAVAHLAADQPIEVAEVTFVTVLSEVQTLLMSNITLPLGIARNAALSENVFMMFVCIQLAIPLVLVGKPGSSKSLAKQLLQSAMSGGRSRDAFFRHFREIQLFSYQCSPLSVSEGILETFARAKRLQDKKNGSMATDRPLTGVDPSATFVSVVVLDEVGLAEDSPRMPLKVLHSLLEERQVAFVGISNWALDPAKMNRAIQITRTSPNEDELVSTARGICMAGTEKPLEPHVERLLKPLSDAYRHVSQVISQQTTRGDVSDERPRDFYGLRDFYFLIKSVLQLTRENNGEPLTSVQMDAAIRRNFGGVPNIDVVLEQFFKTTGLPRPNTAASTSQLSLIDDCLKRQAKQEIRAFSDVRYLLVLTQQQSAFSILFSRNLLEKEKTEIFVGSAFPRDQSYAQICRKINRIKVCMETGRTVLLLNMESLYESLYDLLNGSYTFAGEQRYVDLGLGSHRVKCRVHPNFRLVIVAEQEKVYRDYAIPLINRLEKHLLSTATLLREHSNQTNGTTWNVKESVEGWLKEICPRQMGRKRDIRNFVFCGFPSTNSNLLPSLIWHKLPPANEPVDALKLRTQAFESLMSLATPEGILRTTKSTANQRTLAELQSTYWREHAHDRLSDLLRKMLALDENDFVGLSAPLTAMILTHARLPTTDLLVKELQTVRRSQESALLSLQTDIEVINLQHYDSEEQLGEDVVAFCTAKRSVSSGFIPSSERLLVITCPDGHRNNGLVACAKLNLQNYGRSASSGTRVHVVILICLDRGSTPTLEVSYDGIWQPAYVDSILPHAYLPSLRRLFTEEPDAPLGTSLKVSKLLSNEAEYNLQLSSILLLCVQSCLARLTYPPHLLTSGGLKRWENLRERIHMIGSLLSDKSSTFAQTVVRQVHTLLKQRDESSLATAWAMRVAESPSDLNEADTFRQALWQTILDYVTTALAQVVAGADAGGNLGVLVEARRNKNVSIERLWTSAFSNPQLFSLVHQTSADKNIEVAALGTSKTCSWFPFSSTIFLLIERFLAADSTGDNREDSLRVVDTLKRQLSSYYNISLVSEDSQASSLGAVIVQDSPSTLLQYLHDFIALRQPMLLDSLASEHQSTAVQLYNDLFVRHLRVLLQRANIDESSRRLHIIDFHVIFPDVQATLRSLHRLIASQLVTPELLLRFVGIPDMAVVETIHWSASLARALLEEAVQQLSPPDQVMKQLNIQQIMERMSSVVENIKIIQPVIQQLYQDYKEQWPKNLSEEMSIAWRRVTACAVFFADVALPSFSMCPPQNISELQNAFSIWSSLNPRGPAQQTDDMAGLRAFLMKYLEPLYQRVGFLYLPIDQIDLTVPVHPVMAECQHVFEKETLERAMAVGKTPKDTCPVCRQKWSAPASGSPALDRTMEAFKREMHRANGFFLDVLPSFLVSVIHFDMPLSPAVLNGPFSVPPRRLIYLLLDDTVEKDATELLGRFEEQSYVLMFLLRMEPSILQLHDIQAGEKPTLLNVALMDLAKQKDASKARAFNNLLEWCVYDMLQQGLPAQLKIDHHDTVAYLRRILNHNLQAAIPAVKRARLKYVITQAAALWLQYKFDLEPLRLMSIATAPETQPEFYLDTRPFALRAIWHEGGVRSVERFVSDKTARGLLPWLNEYNLPQDQRSDSFAAVSSEYASVYTSTSVVLHNWNELVHTRTTLDESIVANATSTNYENRTSLALSLSRMVLLDRKPNLSNDTVNTLTSLLKSKIPVLSSQPFGRTLFAICSDATSRRYHDLGRWPKKIENSSLGGLALHAAVASNLFDGNNLVGQLSPLLLGHHACKNIYLPTMPEDEVAALLRGALFNELSGSSHKVVYQCKCGYPYMIGDCGRPNAEGRCPNCRSTIGGMSHKLVDSSIERPRDMDNTPKGYVIADDYLLQKAAEPCRQLPPTEVVLARSLLHTWLLAGYWLSPDDASREQKLFAERLEHDVIMLARDMGKSQDDVILLLHVIISRMMSYKPEKSVELVNKEGRNQWETEWRTLIISPILKDLQNQLDNANKKASNWRSEGANSFLLTKMETKSSKDLGKPKAAFKIKRFRQIFQSNFMTTDESAPFALLSHFIQQSDQLAQVSLHLLPLLQLIQVAHHVRSVRQDAKLRDLRSRAPEGVSFLLHQARDLRILKNQHASPMEAAESAAIYTEDLPLAELLSTATPAGSLLKTILREFINIHNEFIVKARRLVRRHLEEERKQIEEIWQGRQQTHITWTGESIKSKDEISLLDLHNEHLINSTGEDDMLPLIFLYSLEDSDNAGSAAETYNFHWIERAVAARFIGDRPTINPSSISIAFAEESSVKSTANDLVALQEWAEPIAYATLQKILQEIQVEQQLSSCVKRLAANARFLISGGLPKEQTLEWFEDQVLVLSLRERIASETARKLVQIKQVRTLWQFLDIHRLALSIQNDEGGLEHVPSQFNSPLPDELIPEVTRLMKALDVYRVLVELHTIIHVQLANEDEQIDIDPASPLAKWSEGLERLPEAVQLKHIVAIFKIASLLQLTND